MNFIRHFIQNEDGVTAIEYGMIAALIAIVIMSSIGSIGTSINTLFSNLAGCFNTGSCIF